MKTKTGKKTNICFDCQNACGGCSWSAIDPETEKIRYEPVPGWTAERVLLNLGDYDGKHRRCYTYHVTACPQFVPDEPRAKCAEDYLELTEAQSRWFAERGRNRT